MIRDSMEKLHAEKNRGKIRFAFSMLAEMWKWKITLVNVAILYMNATSNDVVVWRGPYTKNYPPPSGNEEYYTIAPQCKTLRSRI